MDDYLMSETFVLGDPHGFVKLVDAMPFPVFCEHAPETLPDDHEDGDTYCHRAGTVETSGQFGGSTGYWCEQHAPTDREMPAFEPGADGWKGKPRRYLDHREDVIAPGDKRIVDAARVSIAGEGVRPTSSDRKLIRYLLKNRHTTPFEQVRFTFHVRLPIFVARQWIRHRTGSFNEESARYGKLADDFFIPAQGRLMKQATKNKQGSSGTLVRDPYETQKLIREHSERSYRLYEELLDIQENGEPGDNALARELARMVLPVNIYTQWFWTTDLHNLMHFLKLRLHPHAQKEVRAYAEAILPMASAVAPMAMEAFYEFALEAK